MRKAIKLAEVQAVEPLTGISFALECAKDQGVFNNFRILYLFIVDGEIVHVEKSQPYGSFEAFDILDMKMRRSGWNLNSRFKDGDMNGFGGEDRDELVNRLTKKDPELLERIRPALGIKG